MIDLHPAAIRTGAVIEALTDEQAQPRTPCGGLAVRELSEHLATVARRLAAVARRLVPGSPVSDGGAASAAWRDRTCSALTDLADAWSEAGAWDGTVSMGGREVPAKVAGHVALQEVVIHGWDLAIATGQALEVDVTETEILTRFVSRSTAPRTGSIFGPALTLPGSASPFDRLLGLAGRNPSWQPDAESRSNTDRRR